MRRQKNLDESINGYGEYFIKANYGNQNASIINEEDKHYFDFAEIFGNSNPVWLEIGCGKGQFICELAKRMPDVNFFAVEKNPSVLSMACKKALQENVTNVRFFNCSAEYLARYFPAKSIGRIYLNFSCPFPKHAYRNRRMTSEKFLDIYKVILQDGAEIHQKTDNMQFFEFSLETFSSNGFAMKNISLDLHKSGMEDNIVTEYEKRFSDMGMPIYRLEAYIKNIDIDK